MDADTNPPIPARIALSHMKLVMTDIHAGHEQAWNQWYENDHFYAGCVLGPGCLSGARWHSSRSLRQARHVADGHFFKDPRAGGALATYAHCGPDASARFRAWVVPMTKALRHAGRMFEHRDVLNADFYQYVGCQRGPRASAIAPHVVQDYPWAGLLLTFAHGVPAGGDSVAEDLPAGSVTLSFLWEVLPPYSPVGPDLRKHAPIAMFLTYL